MVFQNFQTLLQNQCSTNFIMLTLILIFFSKMCSCPLQNVGKFVVWRLFFLKYKNKFSN